MSSLKYVIGAGLLLDKALANWHDADATQALVRVEIGQKPDYGFDLSALDAVTPETGTAFVAWGPQFLNFRRLELMGLLKERGLKMPPLLCTGAVVSPQATIGENTVVGAGSTVAATARIGFNCVIGEGCRIGFGSRVDASVWMGDDVQVGMQARVGSNSVLGNRTSVAQSATVGRFCVLDSSTPPLPKVAPKTFYMAGFRDPVVIIDGHVDQPSAGG